MKIDELLDKYFEGATSCEEERELRRYFTEEEVPEHLQMYRPLFACLDMEAKEHRLRQQEEADKPKADPKRLLPHRWYYSIGGIAAGLLILVGVANLYRHTLATPTDYVIINGKRYTDANLIREQALSAFQDVSMSQEEVLDLMFE